MNTPSLKPGMHVVILGAGVSGLSLAWFLKKKWGSKIRLSIIERQPNAGGWLSTDKSTGFLFEQGPRSFRTKGSGHATLRLIKQLGLKDSVILADANASKRYLYLDGILRKVSLNPFSFPMRAALPGLLREPFVSKGKAEDESIADFFRRRTSRFVVDQLIDPMSTGIYAGNIEELSMRSCFPKLWNLEQSHGSLLKGMWSRKRSKPDDPWIEEVQKHPIFTLKDGVGSLIKELETQLKESLWLNSSVSSIKPEGDQLLVATPNMTFRADFVFSTLPANRMIGLTESPYLENLMRCIPYSSVAVVNLGYKRNVTDMQGFGYLIPSNQKEINLGTVWDSSVFPAQNHFDPETRLTVMLGGSHHPEIIHLHQQELLRLALISLSKQMNVLFEPDAYKITVIRQGIPQYRVGHHVLLREIEQAAESFSPRLKLLGSSFYGVAVNDCIAKAEEMV